MSNRRRATPKFSCKECLHTDFSQEAIAVHYLQKHMDVDFCSLSTPVEDTSNEGMPQPSRGRKRKIATRTSQSKSDSGSMETPGDSDELGRGKRRRRMPKRFLTESELDKPNTDKVFPSHARKIKKDKKDEEEESARVEGREICSEKKETGEKDSTSTNECLGSEQGVKIDTATEESPANNDKDRHVVAEALQEAADDIHATLDKEQHVSCDSTSEVTEKHTESSQGHADKPIGTKRRKMTVKKGSSCTASRRAKNRKRKRHEVRKPHLAADSEDGKNGTEIRTDELKCTSADCDGNDLAGKIARSETVNQKIKRLPVALEQFNQKVEKTMHQWRVVQKRRKEESIRTCSFPDCSLKMMEHELLLHETCHAKSVDGLRCPHCDFMCLHWRHMRKHLQKRHARHTGRLYHCDQDDCKHTFDRSNQLRRHVLEKHIKEQLVDEILSGSIDLKEFQVGSEDTKAELNGGQTTQNNDCGTNEDTSSRPHTKKKQKRRKNDRAHREKSDDNHREKVTFICELCAAKFRDETSMLEHKQSHITDQEGTFYCPECTIICAGVEMLREHYREEHKNKLMRYQCAKCPFATNRFYQMSTHQAMHTGQKGVTCQQCGKTLANQYNLKVHKFRKHTTEEQKTVECSACPYRCADKSVLRDHIKQHHKHMLKNPIYHRCPQCDYVGHKKQSLEFHMRVHTEQRRFKCNRCPYASKTKNHLKIHMQTHEGLQPASCQFCDFRAASKKRLSEHIMRRHLHIEPYLCKICQWRTAYSGNMWKHLNQHRKDLGTEMPEEPVIIDTDLLKGVVLPEMPKAPTGKMRGQSRTDSAEYTAMTLGQTLIEARHEVGLYELSGHQEVAPGSELQVVQISEETVGRPDAECDGGVPGDSHLQLVEIHDNAIGVNTIGQQVVAQLQDTNSQLSSALGDSLHEKLGHMEIFISHDAVGKTGESDKVVEVLHVREDGSIVSSTMNRDVEVAVLALAQLEPGTHTTELPSGVGDGSRITIVQTVQQDQDAHCVHDAAVSAAIEAGIHTSAAKDNDDDALDQMPDATVQQVSIQTHSDEIAQDVVELASQNGHSSADVAGHCDSDMKVGGKSDGHNMTAL